MRRNGGPRCVWVLLTGRRWAHGKVFPFSPLIHLRIHLQRLRRTKPLHLHVLLGELCTNVRNARSVRSRPPQGHLPLPSLRHSPNRLDRTCLHGLNGDVSALHTLMNDYPLIDEISCQPTRCSPRHHLLPHQRLYPRRRRRPGQGFLVSVPNKQI